MKDAGKHYVVQFPAEIVDNRLRRKAHHCFSVKAVHRESEVARRGGAPRHRSDRNRRNRGVRAMKQWLREILRRLQIPPLMPVWV
jgi:hypothetical protein